MSNVMAKLVGGSCRLVEGYHHFGATDWRLMSTAAIGSLSLMCSFRIINFCLGKFLADDARTNHQAS